MACVSMTWPLGRHPEYVLFKLIAVVKTRDSKHSNSIATKHNKRRPRICLISLVALAGQAGWCVCCVSAACALHASGYVQVAEGHFQVAQRRFGPPRGLQSGLQCPDTPNAESPLSE